MLITGLLGRGIYHAEKFDILAKTSTPAPERLHELLRALLADRFRLQVHGETRDLTVYALVPDRRGATLRASRAEASAMRKLPGGGLRLDFRKTTIAELAAFLSTLAAVDRPVRDATGLDGAYDFTLDLHELDTPDGASLPTLLQEQLGLRVETRKAPVEILVVDHAERPSAN